MKFVSDSPIEGLPSNIKLLVVDGPTLFVRRHFNDQFLHFKVNVNIVDIASVGGVVAAVSDTGRLYNMTIFGGSPVFKDITHTFSKKFAKMKSVSVWRSEGRRCFVDLMKPFFCSLFCRIQIYCWFFLL